MSKSTYVPPKIGEMRGPLDDGRGGVQFAVYGPNGWLYTHSQPGESVEACRARAKEWTDRVLREYEQESKATMPTTIGTAHYTSKSAIDAYYHKEGGGDGDLALAEGRICIGKPPTKPGETLKVRGGRYHIVTPDVSVKGRKPNRNDKTLKKEKH